MKRRMQVSLLLVAVAVLIALALPAASLALPNYTPATGQACTVCHVNATGTGGLTAAGQRFAAVPNHQTNPAAAWQQISQPAQATPAATAAPAATARPATTPAATAAPAATPAATARPATTPAATAAPVTGGKDATATPAPTTLPRTGDVSLALFAAGALSLALAGFGIRKIGR